MDAKVHTMNIQVLSSMFLLFLEFSGTKLIMKKLTQKKKASLEPSSSKNENGKRVLQEEEDRIADNPIHHNSLVMNHYIWKSLKRYKNVLSEKMSQCLHLKSTEVTDMFIERKFDFNDLKTSLKL